MTAMQFDKVIKGGTIIDGQRTPRYVSDIGIKDGLIAYIGGIEDCGDAEVIEAKGLNVVPGFIDLHTHYDAQLFWDPYCTISSWHGVTTVCIGNCGFGFAPCRPAERDRSMLMMARNEAIPLASMQAGMPWDWETFPEFLDSVDRTPKGVNIMTYVPLNPLLIYAMGLDAAKTRSPTEEEWVKLAELFNEAIDAGGYGFSFQYEGEEAQVQRDFDGTLMPTDVMTKDDLVRFAKLLRAKAMGGIQLLSLSKPETAILMAEASGRPVVWNALTISADQHGLPREEEFEPTVRWLAEANGSGKRVFAQGITRDGGHVFTMEDWNLFDVNPLWREATVGTHDEKIAKFSDPEMRRKLREDSDLAFGGLKNLDLSKVIGTTYIIETTTPEWEKYCGYTIAELAAEQGKHLIDAFLDLVVGEDLQTTFETRPKKNSPAARKALVSVPTFLPGVSDGGAHTKFITSGSFPTSFLIDYVRDEQVLGLEEAHWRLSAIPAQAACLKDRGVLREGFAADIVIYDMDKLAKLPKEIARDVPANEWRRISRAEGYRYILVNGEATFVAGDCTNRTPGKLLRHGQAEPIEYAMAAE